MARKPSPLRTAKAHSISVCGKMLQKGQSIIVNESAIGPRELTQAQKGKIRIIKAQEKGKKQILCTLP